MDDIDAAFDDAYRTNRIEAGDDPSTLLNPYSRPSLTTAATSNAPGSKESNDTGVGGGFVVDDNEAGSTSGGGGFMVDDADDEDAGGGFILDDDDAAIEGGGGGFMPEDEDAHAEPSSSSAKAARPSTIPLSAIPEALANLGLDSADPSVLSLFAETAYVPSSASRRRLAPGAKPEKVVGRQEFQQVASILLDEMRTRGSSSSKQKHRARDDAEEDDDDGEDQLKQSSSRRRRPTRRAAVKGRQKAAEIVGQSDDDAAAGGGGGGFIVDEDADNSEEDFEASRQRRRRRTGKASALDTGSDLTSDDDDEDDAEQADPARRRRRRRRGGARPAISPSPSIDSDSDTQHTPKRQRRTRASEPSIRSTAHLNPLQRSTATSLFQLLLDRLPASSLPAAQRRIGTTELTAILNALGEKIPPKEVEEMLEEGAKLFAPAAEAGEEAQRKSSQAIKGAAAAQGIVGASVGLDEFAGVLVHNRLL